MDETERRKESARFFERATIAVGCFGVGFFASFIALEVLLWG